MSWGAVSPTVLQPFPPSRLTVLWTQGFEQFPQEGPRGTSSIPKTAGEMHLCPGLPAPL